MPFCGFPESAAFIQDADYETGVEKLWHVFWFRLQKQLS